MAAGVAGLGCAVFASASARATAATGATGATGATAATGATDAARATHATPATSRTKATHDDRRVGAGADAGLDTTAPTIAVTMACDPVASVGRVRCEAKATVDGGRVVWGDVVVVGAPAFIEPLRGRVGPSEAVERSDATWRWSFALIAKARGEGSLEARVRLVVCTAGGICAPHDVMARAPVVVR